MRYPRQAAIAAVRDGHAAGLPDVVIALQLGVSQTTIWRWRVLVLGLPPARKHALHFEARYGRAGGVVAFRKRYLAGLSYAQLGRHFGMSRQCAEQWARALGLPRRRRAA